MSAATVSLGDVANFIRGITYKPPDLVENFSDGSVVCLRTANVQATLDDADVLSIPRSFVRSVDKLLREGDLLVSTANSWNLVGKCCWVPALPYPATVGGFIAALRADAAKVDPRYLYRWFSSPRTQALARNCGRQTTNISNMDLKRCLALQLPLPPLAEQRRIAAILDKADALSAKRHEAIGKLDRLLQSVFLEMFGDPVKNPKGWEAVKVGDVFSGFIGGKNVECPDESSSQYRILKVSAVTSKIYRPEESKPAPVEFAPSRESVVQRGDLLFSRANTAELVAATAFVWNTPDNIVLPDKLWKLRIADTNRVEPLFVWELFKNPTFRNELSKRSSGTSGSMKNISKSKLEQVLMPLPPIEAQQRFAKVSSHIHAQLRALHASLEQFSGLFSTLQAQAFSGARAKAG